MLMPMMTRGVPSDSATTVRFHPSGRLVATGTVNGVVVLWDAQTGREVSTYEPAGRNIRSVVFSPDGTLVAYGGHGRWIRVRDVSTGRLVHDLLREPHLVHDVAFSPSGELIASAEAAQGQSETHSWRRGEIHIWRINTMYEEAILTLDSASIAASAVAFGPDGRTIAGGGADMSLLTLWDLASYTPVPLWKAEPHIEWTAALAFSPDGRLLASAGDDGTVQLWSVTNASRLATLTGHQVAGKTLQPYVTAICFRPDGKLLASGSYDKTIRLWNVDTSKEIERIEFSSDVLSLAFSPDGRIVAGGSRNEPVTLWRTDV